MATLTARSGAQVTPVNLDNAITQPIPTDAVPADRSKQRRSICAITILLADVAGFVLSFAIATALTDISHAAPTFMIVAAVVIAMRGLAGLYPGDRLHPQETLRRHTISAFIGAGVAAAASFALYDGRDAALTTLLLIIALVVQTPIRHVARDRLHRAGFWGTPIRLISEPDLTLSLTDYFTKNWQIGLIPTREKTPFAAITQMPCDATIKTLSAQYQHVLLLADLPMLHVSGFSPTSVGGAIGLSLVRPGPTRTSATKRIFDLAIALPALMLVVPVLLCAAGAIWLVDPGPVFYRQNREGQGGRILRMLKLRTMYCDAEERLKLLLRDSPAARAEWETRFKLRNDPRILPIIGKFLRASSCDELPQLLHVITGEMSVVGPRPFPEYHLAAMPTEFRMRRHSVAPGITGLWQITARSDSDLALQQQLDEHYIDNRSVWLDLRIVLGTFTALIGRKGAY